MSKKELTKEQIEDIHKVVQKANVKVHAETVKMRPYVDEILEYQKKIDSLELKKKVHIDEIKKEGNFSDKRKI